MATPSAVLLLSISLQPAGRAPGTLQASATASSSGSGACVRTASSSGALRRRNRG